MSIDYSAIAVNALAVLADAGTAVTRRSYTDGTYNPATGAAAPTTADTARTGVVLNYSTGLAMVRGALIKGGDKRLLLDAVGVAPALTDRFIVFGTEYRVVSIDETNPAGTPVLYDLHLTKT